MELYFLVSATFQLDWYINCILLAWFCCNSVRLLDQGSIHDRSLFQHKYSNNYSSQSTCYSSLQDSTPQLTTTVRDNLPQRTQDRNVQRPICSTTNRTTLAPTIYCPSQSLTTKLVTPEIKSDLFPSLCTNATNHAWLWKQKVPILALVAHLLLWKSVSIVASRNNIIIIIITVQVLGLLQLPIKFFRLCYRTP
jgi:hypothetical protein